MLLAIRGREGQKPSALAYHAKLEPGRVTAARLAVAELLDPGAYQATFYFDNERSEPLRVRFGGLEEGLYADAVIERAP